jgi:ubiquinone/menaquinone biosynthesis C-methylase UbiE
LLNYEEIKKIRKLYINNKNISQYIKKKDNATNNSIDAILYSYDLQGGKDYSLRNYSMVKNYNKKIAKKISETISNLGVKSFLEAGTGEGLILGLLNPKEIKSKPSLYGFDLTVSRLLYAQKYLKQQKKKATLFSANMMNIPLGTNSVDVVCTVMSMEPNHGREKSILSELFRITRKYLILIEPTYELGSEITKKHIIQHGYVRNLPNIIKKMGYKIITHEYLGFSTPNNENAIIVAEKNPNLPSVKNIKLLSPISHKPLIKKTNLLYCKEDGYAFPLINNIPCLVSENGILASKLMKFN